MVRSPEGEVLGFLHAQRSDDGTVELGVLYLRNGLKGRGVADQLMQQFMTWAGNAAMKLSVASYNERAIRFYHRYGFTLTDEHWVELERVPLVSMVRDRPAQPHPSRPR